MACCSAEGVCVAGVICFGGHDGGRVSTMKISGGLRETAGCSDAVFRAFTHIAGAHMYIVFMTLNPL